MSRIESLVILVKLKISVSTVMREGRKESRGISAWDLKLEGTNQSNLIITPTGEPTITVDNLEVAQFIYLLLNSEKIRNIINTIGKKGVLILGRLSERKSVLDAIRKELRLRDYVPIVFDFERRTDGDFRETIMTLAGMSRFIIADMTKPRSVPLELQARSELYDSIRAYYSGGRGAIFNVQGFASQTSLGLGHTSL